MQCERVALAGSGALVCCASLFGRAGTPYPVLRTGSEFNELAPQSPEKLEASRSAWRSAAHAAGAAASQLNDGS